MKRAISSPDLLFATRHATAYKNGQEGQQLLTDEPRKNSDLK